MHAIYVNTHTSENSAVGRAEHFESEREEDWILLVCIF